MYLIIKMQLKCENNFVFADMFFFQETKYKFVYFRLKLHNYLRGFFSLLMSSQCQHRGTCLPLALLLATGILSWPLIGCLRRVYPQVTPGHSQSQSGFVPSKLFIFERFLKMSGLWERIPLLLFSFYPAHVLR